jgi:hypothetical protein
MNRSGLPMMAGGIRNSPSTNSVVLLVFLLFQVKKKKKKKEKWGLL